MEDESTTKPTFTGSPFGDNKPKKRSHTVILWALVALLAVAAAGVGGFTFGASQQKSSETASSSTKTQQTTTTTSTFHTVLAASKPYGVDKTITAKLAIPNRLQAVSITSTGQDPGLSTVLASNFNDEVGRWRLGNPVLSGSASNAGEVSLLHVGSSWLQQNTTLSDIDTTYFTISKDWQQSGGSTTVANTIFGYNMSTPAAKQAALKQLETDTKTCAASDSKGFTISSLINVCYAQKLIRETPGEYAPRLDLKGYGVIDGQAYMLFGSIALTDETTYSEDEAAKKADEFLAGNIPAETQKLATELVNALKQSSITAAQ